MPIETVLMRGYIAILQDLVFGKEVCKASAGRNRINVLGITKEVIQP
jgi:hypothetical protein